MYKRESEDMKRQLLQKELTRAKFNSVNDVIQLLRKHDLTLDKAKDNTDVSFRTELILRAYIEKCPNPKLNITALTQILGEEDLNVPLLKHVEKYVREREKKENNALTLANKQRIKLPSLILTIREAEGGIKTRDEKEIPARPPDIKGNKP